MNDLAGYLGAKYGGWFDIAKLYGTQMEDQRLASAMPIGGGTGPTVYRMSWVKQAGYDKIPDDLDGFLTLCQKLQADRPSVRLLARPRGGRCQRLLRMGCCGRTTRYGGR